MLFQPEPVQRPPRSPELRLHEIVIAHGEQAEWLMGRGLFDVRLEAQWTGRGQHPEAGIHEVKHLVDIDAEQHVAAGHDRVLRRAPQHACREPRHPEPECLQHVA